LRVGLEIARHDNGPRRGIGQPFCLGLLVDQRDIGRCGVVERGRAVDRKRAVANHFAVDQSSQCRQSRRHIGILSVVAPLRSHHPQISRGTNFNAALPREQERTVMLAATT